MNGARNIPRGKAATLHVTALALVCLVGLVCSARAQTTGVTLTVPPGGLGLDGIVQPGSWTPLRLSIDNASAEDRDVLLTWLHRDSDGDRVAAQRRVTLTRQRAGQRAWLYAAIPMTVGSTTRWTVTATDADSGQRLAALDLRPETSRIAPPGTDLIAVTSIADLGLNDYQRSETHHAPLRLVRGLSLDRTPDRWMGLASLHAFIWTRDLGGDPADPLQTSEASLAAMREWVYRGGHLIIDLPAVGQTWTASPLADLLPVTAGEMRSTSTTDWPRWLGGLRQEDRPALSLTVFDLNPDNPAAVLLRDNDDRPVAIAKRYGFGRVTLIGLDLTQQALQLESMPYGPDRMWNRLFGWLAPVFSSAAAEGMIQERQLVPADRLDPIELGSFIPSRIAMTGTVGAVLVGALVVFGLYWVLAGWLVQPLLKTRGLERYSWVGFVAVVVVFTGVAWGGAALLRPAGLTAAHFSVLDLDGNGGPARVRSNVSIFVPRFGPAAVALPGERLSVLGGISHDALASPGLSGEGAGVGFADTQEYVVDAASPNAIEAVPMRATSKEFRLDYLGPVDGEQPGLAVRYRVDVNQPIRLGEDGWPTGRLTHDLPGALRNVLIVFCRGEGYDPGLQQLEPLVWSYADEDDAWSPGEALTLGGAPARAEKLMQGLGAYGEERDYAREGYLGRLLGQHKGADPGEALVAVDESVIARELVLLSFFDAVPPPNFRKSGFPRGYALRRALGQGLDLTPLLHGRRLIILGHLPSSPLPAPLTVDGETVPSEGWTLVRWVYDF